MNRAVTILCLGILTMALSNGLAVGEDVSGILHGNIEWSGDIHVVGDVMVHSDATLTITPGTTVRFAANQNANPLQQWDTTHSWILVRGRLLANGKKSNWISFTSDAGSPSSGDWGCIFFENMSGTSSFKYCIVEYGDDQINASGENAAMLLTIQNCIIRHALSGAILLGSTGNYDIQFNTIYNNKDGIILHRSMAVQKNVTFSNNIVTNNELGIVNATNFQYTTSFNDVWNNIENYLQTPGAINYDLDMSVDPRYVSFEDVHLTPDSPCLKASSTGGEIGAYGNSRQFVPAIPLLLED